MKNLLSILAFISLFGCATQVQAQYVTIPDANFRTFLQFQYPSCFDGQGRMDTTCTAITSETALDLEGLNMTNLEGVQYFDGLQSLICSNNSIMNFPRLPSGLLGLQCSNCQLMQLPALPSGLQDLFCDMNNLNNMSLSGLPTNLLSLNCSFNMMISQLPPLPVQLMTLYCMGMPNLTELPALPNNLQILNFGGTEIACLPTLPNSLNTLGVNSRVTCLPNYTGGVTAANTSLPLCIPNTCLPVLCDGSGLYCVFPGDTNHDGICNNFDVLPISVLDGQAGTVRANATTNWYGQPSANWNTTIPNTAFDAKFADANGSALIDSMDINAVYTNYNRTNNGTIPTNRGINSENAVFPIKVVFTRDTFNIGLSDTITADIFVGSTTLAATNFYGFAASITYDSTLFKPLSIQYNNASFMGSDQQVNVFGINNVAAEKYDIALARRTRTNITGQGRVARIKGVIAENVASKSTLLDNIALSFGITNVLAINVQNQSLPNTAIGAQCQLSGVTTTTESRNDFLDKNVVVAPNPVRTNGVLQISTKNCTVQRIELTDMLGKLMLSQTTNSDIILQNLSPALYFARIYTDKGMITKKIVVQ
jgi:Secretion system C-terminal sorting domain